MKPNTVFRRAYNRGLIRLRKFAVDSNIGSETSWAQSLSVSRTTVRSVLTAFAAAGLIAYDGRSKTLLRHPVAADFRPETETEACRGVRRQALHGLDPARRQRARTVAQRHRAFAPVRRLGFRDRGIPQSVAAAWPARSPTERRLDPEGLHRGLRRRALRSEDDIRVALRPSPRRARRRRSGLERNCRGSRPNTSRCCRKPTPGSPISPNWTNAFTAASTTFRTIASSRGCMTSYR